MLEFEWIWMFALLPLPLLIRLLPAKNQVNSAKLRMPFLHHLPGASVDNVATSKMSRLIVPSIIWVLLISATARPQWLGEPITLPSEGRDLMLAVDLSGSMEVDDMQVNDQAVNRLQMVKYVLSQFIERRVGDRLGLILFADTAYLQTPLTHDRTTVQDMLNEAQLRMIGEKTAIGDAIGLAAKRFEDKEDSNRILILLTDGQNTSGNIEPTDALELAKEKNITIYTIGVGADQMTVRSFFGRRTVNPSSELDEGLLTQLAQATGGQYFRAKDTQGLENIYNRLDELEPIQRDTQTLQPLTSLFHYPLAAAFILLLLSLLASFFSHSKPITKKEGNHG